MPSATSQRDYYEVLGVPSDADDKAIKDAFRRLALKYHPDRSTEPDAEARFKEIAEAYAVLSDPAKRAEYDARGFEGVSGLSPEDLFGGIDFGDLFGPFGSQGSNLFERLFHPARHRGPPRGDDIEVLLTVPLSTVLTGGEETVTIRRPGPCAACGGTGARAGTQPRRCDDCGGTGRRTTRSHQAKVVVQHISPCATCRGRGTIIDEPCPECRGSGVVDRQDHVKVRIPAGIEDGTALRIPGHGMASGDPKGVPGDAYVVVATAADSRFVRRGPDLWRTAQIGVPDAVLGVTLRVPTLEGDVRFEVPPGTQPGTVLRIAGKGLPRLGVTQRGDLLVTVAVRIPDRVSLRDRRLWERLRNKATAPAARRRRLGTIRTTGAAGTPPSVDS